MSLINDALKRASQAKPPPLPLTEPEPPLQPVEYKRPSRWPFFLLPALLLVAGLAGWVFLKGWQTARSTRSSEARFPVAARELPADEQATSPGQPGVKFGTASNNRLGAPASDLHHAQASAGAAVPVGAKSSVATIVTPANNLPATNAEPAKPTFPAVRLQGVFYRPNHPSVVINAKTVSVGEKVAGAKVVAITRDSVTLEWNGETRVLTLE